MTNENATTNMPQGAGIPCKRCGCRADHAAILESAAGANPEDADELEPYTEIGYTRRMLVSVPFGWKLSQLKAEQPTTTYGDFKNQIINEIARCLNMPFNVAAGNSGGSCVTNENATTNMPQGAGIPCKRCGCRASRTIDTRKVGNRIRRKRKCRYCLTDFVTFESLPFTPPNN